MKNVRKKYDSELKKIYFTLDRLEKGKIKELSQCDRDGYLATNIVNIKEQFESLLNKIEIEAEGESETLAKAKDEIDNKMNLAQ